MAQDLKSLIILFKAHQSLERNVKLSLEDSRLSVNEFTALEALHVKKKLTTQALIDAVLIPNSSMSHVIKTLEQKGYLTRTRDQADRRTQYLSLTEEGEAVFSSVYKKHFRHMRELFDILNEQEEEDLQIILKKLGKNARRRLNDHDSHYK